MRRTGYAELGVRLTDLFNKWTEVAEGVSRNGNPGAVGSKYATGFAGVESREEAIVSQGGSEVG